MSQAKVDQYKKQKANRKKEMRKEKMERTIVGIGAIIVAAAICVWIGYSIYGAASGTGANDNSSAVSVNTSAVDDYLSGLEEE